MRKNAFSVFHVNLPSYIFKIGLLTFLIGSSSLFAQVAVNDTVDLVKNQGGFGLQPLVNDTLLNPDKTVLTVELGDSAQNSRGFSISTNSSGVLTITYDPADGFEGRDTVTYTICDTSLVGACDKADIIYQVGKVPFLPLARDDSSALAENGVLFFDVTENDTITTVGSMEVRLVSNGTNGNAVITGDSIEYTPALGFVGDDVITYAYCDVFDFAQGGVGNYCDTALLTITVNSLHTNGNEYDTIIQPQETLTITELLDNNLDLEDDSLFVNEISVVNNTMSTIEVTNPFLNIFTYTPGDYTGEDTIAYTVCDTIGQCVNDTLFIFVGEEVIIDNPLPVLALEDLSYDVFLGDTVTIEVEATDDQVINLKNPFGFSSTSSISGLPSAAGVLTFRYIAGANPLVDTFTVDVCEVLFSTNCSEVSIIVTVVDTANAPVAMDDAITIKEGEVADISIFSNDSYFGNVTSYSITNNPSNGTISLDSADESSVLTYTPDDNFYGNDEITYELCRNGVCDEALVVVTVEPLFTPLVIEGVSPDGDDINDVFTIEDVDYDLLEVSVKIYNRWGTPIYSEEDYDARDMDKSWSGQSDIGGEVVDGTYFYLVKIPGLGFEQSGNLVLIKKK